MLFLIFTCLKCLIIIIPLLIAVAYFTLAERKLLGAIQRRKGPNVIGVFGLLQPLSDGLKLFLKESIIPSSSDKFLFILAPILTFSVSLLSWSVIPLSKYGILSDIDLSVLYIFAASSLGVYGIIVSGWSSNSKYAFLGALRSAAQMVSYEVSIGFVVVIIVICAGSFNLQQIIHSQLGAWHVVTFLPLFMIFFISALAETNRHPFDLPEAEAELVSGYNVEYAGMGFALFSLGEYTNMLQMSALNTILFFGGWLPFFSFLDYLPTSFWFSLKIGFFVALFIIMRAAFPRYRYDQLMNLGWKTFLPVSLAYLMLTFFILISFNSLPF